MFCFITYFLNTIASNVMGDALMLFSSNFLMAVLYVFRKFLDGDRFITCAICNDLHTCVRTIRNDSASISFVFLYVP